MTARHLFTHTGGWLGDYFADTGPGDDALARAVERVANLPQETPLGEIYSYNNAGFYLAGRLVEVLSGMTYEMAVHKLVLGPLGMKTSFFLCPGRDHVPRGGWARCGVPERGPLANRVAPLVADPRR